MKSILITLLVATLQLHAQSTPGDIWIKMTPDTQTGFVWGYTIGLSRGYAQGCAAYYKFAPAAKATSVENSPFSKCVRGGFGFSKDIAFYVKHIAEFYETYPSDRDIQIEDVLKRLSDSEQMSTSRVHEYYLHHRHGK